MRRRPSKSQTERYGVSLDAELNQESQVIQKLEKLSRGRKQAWIRESIHRGLSNKLNFFSLEDSSHPEISETNVFYVRVILDRRIDEDLIILDRLDRIPLSLRSTALRLWLTSGLSNKVTHDLPAISFQVNKPELETNPAPVPVIPYSVKKPVPTVGFSKPSKKPVKKKASPPSKATSPFQTEENQANDAAIDGHVEQAETLTVFDDDNKLERKPENPSYAKFQNLFD